MGGAVRPIPHASTRAAVLDVIRAAGTISRVGLIAATGFTGATISTVVRRLIDDDLVVETGRAESTGGKPRVLLQLNPAARYAVGVHLDHSGITYVLTDLSGAVVARMSRTGAGAEDPPAVVARIARETAALVAGAGVEERRVLGVGLVAPGPLTARSGMRPAPPPLRGWADFPLDDAVGEATGLPVVLGNDATAAALGEYWSGAVKGSATFAAVYVCTGIGAGILVNGIPYHGTSGNAGEIGHVCVAADGPECWCGARGCTEALAGPAAVVAAARADAGTARAAGLAPEPRRGTSSVAADFAAVARAARRGDPGPKALMDRSARYLAVATRTLATVLDLDRIVLTGQGLAVAGSIYLPAIQEELDRTFFARESHPVAVQLSTSAATAPAIGAATTVLQSELVPLHTGTRIPADLAEEEQPRRAPAARG
ncbi:ROK family transcriptional regulator [Streptomonospora sp. S1-112]|uniref:ROK family transcriptional regulator n=1 Tax=Streptomonospora mangrovi TaxID=2883123 RepID=A0A9X3NPG1_9ACTN|nr:ROK family transcriptional regulator [Streptomonospora mangrovi]MDA0567472.1 ROK family transcriptional regulator [Streptomonospora mangrovi]